MRKVVIASSTVTIEKSQDGEYRVPAQDGYENGTYYTDDKQDAIDTAKKIYGTATPKFKNVTEFVGPKYSKYRPGSKQAVLEFRMEEDRIKTAKKKNMK